MLSSNFNFYSHTQNIFFFVQEQKSVCLRTIQSVKCNWIECLKMKNWIDCSHETNVEIIWVDKARAVFIHLQLVLFRCGCLFGFFIHFFLWVCNVTVSICSLGFHCVNSLFMFFMSETREKESGKANEILFGG